MQREVFRFAAACDPDAVVFAGDAAYAGNSDSLRRRMLKTWKRDWGGLWDRVYAVAGNHDIESPRALEIWRGVMPERSPSPPYAEGLGFRLRTGPLLVIGIDTTSGVVDSTQREWVAGLLARSRAPHRLAVFHEPAFPAGLHRGHSLDAVPGERDLFWDTLQAGGVAVALNGHEHAYARTEISRATVVHQVITGGAGGDLYSSPCPEYDVFHPDYHLVVIDANPETMLLRAIDLAGELIDEVEIASRQPIGDLS